MNKKKYLLGGVFLIVFFSVFYLAHKMMRKDSSHPEKQTIILFNWGEFIEPSLINDFNEISKEYVIKQSFFSSNELAVNKIKAGDKYDIAILSEYAIEKLNKEEPTLLEKIDYNKIDKLKDKKEIDDIFTTVFKGVYKERIPEDIKPYTIPYFWGNLGLLYNTKKIKESEIPNWKDLMMGPENKISLYNNSFEGLFIGLKATGGDIKNPTSDDIIKAKKWLLDLKKTNNKLSFVTDQLLDQMKIEGEEKYDISLTYSGDARFLMNQNKNLKFYPFNAGDKKERGTNIWVDSIVLPKNANTKGAYAFINFLLEKDKIRKNAEFIGYDSPYEDISEDSRLKIVINKEDQMYQYDKENKKEINDSWNEVYAHPRPQDNYLLFINLFIILVLLLLPFIKSFRKK
ncbi:extracellular solute-binding protein [Candidatus Phytoplasma pruni]|uniref:Extracellular solute-binding protein n=1 Tax=Candidatus Phytoplasma pruni TaxID=479893 RepID=A0A851HJF6_9MOLU|nr:extracellular solute-binding protein [Candidatus Phytoplasma pruni]NWN45963.1 extracellular solute-binding protein [Candidatus Phytoplasma pruni]